MKKTFKYLLFSVVAILFSNTSEAQNNLGHNTDNFAGVHSLGYNPAEIVDSRFNFHMNVVSFATTMSNNYIGIKRKALFSDKDFAFDDPNFTDNYLVERLNGNKKGIFISGEVGFLPSFMINVGKNRKHAFGFNARLRYQVNANGIDQNLAQMSFNELDLASLYFVGIQNENFSIQANVWNEYGFTYGTTVLNTGKHFVTAAGTFKLTQGLADAYFYSDNLDVNFPNDSMVSIDNTDIKFGYSSLLGSDLSNFAYGDLAGGLGIGLDLGAVWEFRPNVDKYKYELDGNPDYLDPRKEKYKLKVGFSVMDMGYTSYKRSNGVYGEYFADRQNIDIEETFGAAFSEFGNSGLDAFQDTLASIFVETQAKKDGYKVALPMKINVYADYNIWKGFYAQLGASIAPGFSRNPEKTRSISEFSITPRFEHKWFSFYLPVSVNSHGNPHLGTGMRIGPLAFGTNDILPLMGKKTIYDANVYLNLSIPITKKLKDKDKDHVSNRKDDCKKEAGPWSNKGCPDTDKDKDGIMDAEDKCPEVPGIEAFNGCPDTDEDGIQDSQDDCPEVAGIEAFNGCPDTDEDGIQDSEDDCPEIVGIEAFNGCPDTDGDGIKDSEDNCPEIAGPKDNNGCPYGDKDGDGILDKEDRCPEVPGPKENEGCPFQDSDNDGVLDKDDECVDVPGPVENKGCPVIEKEVEEALDLAFKNLEFESGKAVIKQSSFSSLIDLGKIMNEHPEFKLLIEGHTDSQGSDATNMALSQKRADAVKTFLVDEGISTEKLFTKAYGETQPIDSNETALGRQNNRRVEMTIVFQ